MISSLIDYSGIPRITGADRGNVGRFCSARESNGFERRAPAGEVTDFVAIGPSERWFGAVKAYLSYRLTSETHDRAVHADTGGGCGRSSAISRRMSRNSVLGTATSAIWNVTVRPWLTTLARQFMPPGVGGDAEAP